MKIKRISTIIVGSMLLVSSLTACTPKQGKAIELTKTSCEMLEGETDIVYALTEETGKVNWSSSDASVASVENGEILGRKAGTATITAVIGKASATCKVVIKSDGTDGVSLCSTDSGYYLEADDKEGVQSHFVLRSTDEKGNVTEETPTDLQYEMYNKQIANVDEKGVITPLAIGPTTMTVTSGDFTCSVDVVISTKLIKNTKDWLNVLQTTDNLDGYYYVTKDLDFSGVNYVNLGNASEIEPTKCFRGTIDGGYHTLKNISASGSLFGPLMDAKISNMAFENVKTGGSGFAPSIFGNGVKLSNLSIQLCAVGNVILTENLDGYGTMEQCMIQLNSSGNGKKLVAEAGKNFVAKNNALVCQGGKMSGVLDGVKSYTSKMDAIWEINETKMLGSAWNYSMNGLPTLSKR